MKNLIVWSEDERAAGKIEEGILSKEPRQVAAQVLSCRVCDTGSSVLQKNKRMLFLVAEWWEEREIAKGLEGVSRRCVVAERKVRQFFWQYWGNGLGGIKGRRSCLVKDVQERATIIDRVWLT